MSSNYDAFIIAQKDESVLMFLALYRACRRMQNLASHCTMVLKTLDIEIACL